jgi:hypothetical protein
MALEAVQAWAGHRSIQSTRVYLHLANDWPAGEYSAVLLVRCVRSKEAGGAGHKIAFRECGSDPPGVRTNRP